MDWNYEDSVKEVRSLILRWNTLTIEVVEKLYNARKELSDRGSWSRNNSYNWTKYLSDIGLERMTAHRWLERYIPEEHKLLTQEELEDRKAQEERARREEQKSAYQKSIDRVARYRKTGIKDDGWGTTEDKLLQEDIDRDKRIEEAKARNAERERQEAEERKTTEEYAQATESLFSMLDASTAKWQERRDFKESIRVSSEGQDDPFVDAIIDYLDTLENDSRKIEACLNIIKVCKRIANDLQSK